MGKVKACVGENEHDGNTFHNVTVARLYKDGSDWKETDIFGPDELPAFRKVVADACPWTYEEAKEQRTRAAA